MQSGRSLSEWNADKFFTPASTLKVVTVAAALEAFGADYRFETPLYAQGRTDAGVLRGNLILVASGDLTLGGRTLPNGRIAFTEFDHNDANVLGQGQLTPVDPRAGLDRLATQVAKSGIRRIDGDVVIDDRLFDVTRSRDLDVECVLTPIMVNDNLIDVSVSATQAGKPARVEFRPATSVYQMDAQVSTVAQGQPTGVRIKEVAPGRITVRGRVAVGEPEVVRTVQVRDPSAFARSLLIEALRRAGVGVEASPLAGNPRELLPEPKQYAHLQQVALLTSPRFSEYAKLILKVSHNPGADTLPLLLAAKHGKRTFAEGMALQRTMLTRAGVDTDALSASDGQGGAPGDFVAPRAMVELLRTAATRPYGQTLHDAMPCLGVDGTLAHAVKRESPVCGKAYAKTGTTIVGDLMNERGVLVTKGLAGYMTDAQGRRLAFAVYVNGVAVDSIEAVMQMGQKLGSVCEIIYQGE